MHLIRCSAQASKSLEGFYADLASEETTVFGSRTGPAMISLIRRLKDLPDNRQVWGLTSHAALCLLSQDAWDSPWHVSFIVGATNEYFVEYRMPDTVAPWPNALVQGRARSEEEALQMILIGMEKSEGWKS